MKLVIFEDAAFENFFPIAYVRPVFDLRCGRTTLREKIERAAGATASALFVRDWLKAVTAAKTGLPINEISALKDDDLLLVNGRCLWKGEAQLPVGRDICCKSGGEIACISLSVQTAEKIAAQDIGEFIAAADKALPSEEIGGKVLSYPWELIAENAGAITDDFKKLGKSGVEGTLAEGALIWGPKDQVYVAPGAVMEPTVVIDTNDGPVIIEEDVVANPHTRIQGPACIGRGTILTGGKIREGASIGPVCRVGGEVEESIMHGYSNKYHDGFLGHAYVCEWVNLGALTTNSDLKNDYAAVEVMFKGRLTDTGSPKVGCFIGDHTKTSIGTLINTGTIIGMMANILGAGSLLPKTMPSFVMYMDGKVFKTSAKRLIETARTAMGRRKVELLPEEEELFKFLFALTKEERMAAVKKSRKEMVFQKGLR